MANPQPTENYMKLNLEVLTELYRRDFTKLHLNIIMMILRYSWGCQKPSACIPQKNFFEVCGVDGKKIAAQLRQLENMQVIIVDKNTNHYQVQKDYDRWKVDINKYWSDEKHNNLLSINLQNKAPDLRGKAPEKGDSPPNKMPPKKGESPSDCGGEPPKKGGFISLFSGGREVEIPYRIRLRGRSIDSIYKYLYIKKKKDSTTPVRVNAYPTFEQELSKGGRPLSSMTNDQIFKMLDEFGDEVCLLALGEAVFYDKRSLSYIGSVLSSWKDLGLVTTDAVNRHIEAGRKQRRGGGDSGGRRSGKSPSSPATTDETRQRADAAKAVFDQLLSGGR